MLLSEREKTKTSFSVANISIPTSLKTEEELTNSALSDSVEDTNILIDKSLAKENSFDDRKQKIMEHLKQSSNNSCYSLSKQKERNTKIREHIKNSLS
ncbi:MAG: hypothetical protein QNJ34_04815 [Xenococcaceae cyanobacterium MO_188.B29]|nr:hypothetical protein [Xenococcaceae cyanobacterium MO_188.B29]